MIIGRVQLADVQESSFPWALAGLQALAAAQNGSLNCHRRVAVTALSAISLSGMKAAQTALGASAHNIANLSMAGFRRDLVTQSSAAGGGVSASTGQENLAGHALQDDLVGQLVAKNQFLTNLAMFRTNRQILGSLLDIAG